MWASVGGSLGGWVKKDIQKLETKTPLALSQFCTCIFEGPSTDSPPQLFHNRLDLSPPVTFSSGVPSLLMSFPVAACFPLALCPISHSLVFHPAAPTASSSARAWSSLSPPAAALCSLFCALISLPVPPVLYPWPCFPSRLPKPSVPPDFSSSSSPGLSPGLALVLLLWIPMREGDDSTFQTHLSGR